MRLGVPIFAAFVLLAALFAITPLPEPSQAAPSFLQAPNSLHGGHALDDTATIVPFEGEYFVGGAPFEFQDLRSAVSMLAIHGVSGPTTFWIAPDTIEGTLVIPPIPGAGETAPVRFVGYAGPVLIRSNSPADTAALILAGAQWITLDGLNVTATGGSVKHAIVVGAGSAHNTIRRATVRGRGASFAGGTGLCLRGGSCGYNTFDSLTIRAAETGLYLDGSTTASDVGSRVTGCNVDSVRVGIRMQRQTQVSVQGCDVQLNGSAAQEIDGILVYATNPGDTLNIFANRIHALATSSTYAVGIRAKTDTLSLARVYNNFVYDFRTTASAQARAFYVMCGNVELTANSVRIGDMAANGATYGVYVSTVAAQGTLTLRNNILTNYEATAVAYGVFFVTSAAPFVSDYNIFYGTGTGYKTGKYGINLVALSAWQNTTGGDAHSLSGDPGFASATDLHLTTSAALAHQNGAVVPWLTTDMDGQTRLMPPDRGADEYVFAAPAKDLAIRDFGTTRASYPELSTVQIPVVVQNRGSQAQTAVPIRLYFNNVLQREVPVTLAALDMDTVLLAWTTGSAGSNGTLKAVCVLAGDAVPSNDSAFASVTLVGQPLAGTYSIGSVTATYPTFSSAIQDLCVRGIRAAVTFAVQPGIYEETVTLPAIDGTSAANRITFRASPAGTATVHSANSGPAWQFNGARFISLDGVNVTTDYPSAAAVEFTQRTSDCDVRSANVSYGASPLLMTAGVGVRFSGGGNARNRLSQDVISGFHDGVRLEGSAVRPDSGTVVDSCTLYGCVTGLVAMNQIGAQMVGNSVHTGQSAVTEAVCGIYLGPCSSGGGVTAERNLLMGGQGSAGGCGIYSNTANGTANLRNNMIGGWSLTGSTALYGILVGGGHANVQFNSLWMNNVASSGDVIGIADTGSAVVVLQNNAIQISEQQNRALCLWHAGTTIISDYNAFCDATGGNSLFAVGRTGTSIRPTLDDWRTTQADLHSVAGNSGFLDSLNLHVRPDAALFHQHGIGISEIHADFDGEVRAQPPDIGADEYTYMTSARDVGTAWLHQPPVQVPPSTAQTCVIVVRNYSTFAQMSVPVELTYDHAIASAETLTLDAGQVDTVTLVWTTPNEDLDFGTLEARCRLSGDVVAANDSAVASVAVIGPPLNGSYTLGGAQADFADVQTCLEHLRYRGVGGPVTIWLEPLVSDVAIVMDAITGATSASRVTFATRQTAEQPAEWRAGEGLAALELNGASHISFEGIAFTAAGTCTAAVELHGGASDISFYDCRLNGADSARSTTVGLWVQTDGCSQNTVDECLVSNAFTGVKLSGNETILGDGNIVRNSSVVHARYGIYLSHQVNAEVSGNDIVPGSFLGTSAPCYGIYLTNLGSGGSANVSGNQIHGFADNSASTANRAVGIYAAAGVDASVTISNNFIYGFEHVGTLKISAIYLSSGLNTAFFNSVFINDAPTTGEISGIYISSGTTHTIKNNIVFSQEDDVTSIGILQNAGGGLISDYNDLNGSSALFRTGRVGSTTYGTLAQWQAAGNDAHGRAVDPRFVSTTDLHISDSTSGVVRSGVFVPTVIGDIDGQVRLNPPDIGADEYGRQGVPDTVRALTISVQNGSLHLRWQQSAGATTYKIYAATTSDVNVWPANLMTVTADTSIVLTPSAGQNRQFFRVTAVNNAQMLAEHPRTTRWHRANHR